MRRRHLAKDAYVALKKVGLLPGIEVRLGQWKVPFGYEQPESDTKLLWVNSSYAVAALSRSTATTSLFANGDSRDLGAGLFGSWSSGAVGAEFATSVVNGAGPNRRDDVEEQVEPDVGRHLAARVFRAERYDRNLAAGDNTNERYTVGAYVDVLPVNARLIFNYELDQSDAPVKTGDRAILFGQVVY